MRKKVLFINQEPIDLSVINFLKKDFEVDLVQGIDAFEILLESKTLFQYDCIFMDPAMDPDPLYSMRLSLDGKTTGHLMYGDYKMEDLDCKIIVWSKDFLDLYEDLLWANNVTFAKKVLAVNTIALLID
jgi:hypothetical protein